MKTINKVNFKRSNFRRIFREAKKRKANGSENICILWHNNTNQYTIGNGNLTIGMLQTFNLELISF